jgi:hypothetical protein
VSEQAAEIAAAGSLEAKIIRKCEIHRTCPLTCPQRQVDDLGTIASFENRPPSAPSGLSILEQVKSLFGGKRQ